MKIEARILACSSHTDSRQVALLKIQQRQAFCLVEMTETQEIAASNNLLTPTKNPRRLLGRRKNPLGDTLAENAAPGIVEE